MIDVNGVGIELSDLDNNDSILKKYASQVKNGSSFFYVFPPEELRNGKSYSVIDIRDEIGQINVFDKKQRAVLLAKYPKYTERDLIVAYFYNKDIEPFSNLRKKLKTLFSSEGDLNTAIRYISEEGEKERRYIQNFNLLIEKFKHIDTSSDVIVATASKKSNAVYAYHLDVPPGLLRNFNEIRVSNKLPYCTVFTSNKKSFFKVYTEAERLWDEWFNDEPDEEDEKIKCYIASKPKKWVSLEWNIHNNLQLTIPPGYGYEQSIREIISSALPGNYELSLPTLLSVGILFNISNVINKNVLSYAIGTDPYLYEFLFFNEFSMPALSKAGEKLGMYLGLANNYNTKTSVSIVLVPDDEGGMLVRINGCNNSDHASRVKYVFIKLLNYYEETAKAKAEAELKKFGLSVQKTRKKKAKKVPAKSEAGKLDLLIEQRPEMFGVHNFARAMCQKDGQPTLLEGMDSKDKARTMYNGDENRFMEYPLNSGDIYICENPTKIYPGLKVNELDNKDEYEYLPCCYLKPQRDPKSTLGEYLIENGVMEGELPSEEKSGDTYHVLASTKLAPPRRLSRLPMDIYLAFKGIGSIGDVVFERKKDPAFSLLRYGVNKSKDSALYCLETAFNQEFILFDDYQQLQHINDLKKRLRIPEEYGEFFNPVDFIDRLMKYYKANIYIFRVDSSSPRGEIVIPGEMYLPKILPVRNTVLLLMSETKDYWKYQYELITKMNEHRQGKYVYNSTFYPEIIERCEKLLEDAYRIYYMKSAF